MIMAPSVLLLSASVVSLTCTFGKFFGIVEIAVMFGLASIRPAFAKAHSWSVATFFVVTN